MHFMPMVHYIITFGDLKLGSPCNMVAQWSFPRLLIKYFFLDLLIFQNPNSWHANVVDILSKMTQMVKFSAFWYIQVSQMNNVPPWYMPFFLKPLLLSFQCCLQKFYFVEKIPCKGKIIESRYFFCHLSLLHEEIEKKLRLEKYFRRFCEKFLFKLILTPIKVKTNYMYTKLYFIAKSKRLIHSQSDSDDFSIIKIIRNVKIIKD